MDISTLAKQLKASTLNLVYTASATLESRMDHKATQDKLRKNNIDFQRRRAQLHKQKLNLDGKKQAKEGNTYQSGIGPGSKQFYQTDPRI